MKRIKEDFFSSGILHFDKNGECHDKKDIARVWHVVFKYPKDEDTTVINGTTYLYCVVMTDKLTDHFWAVYPGNSDPKSAEKSLPEYIVKHLPVNESGTADDGNRKFLTPQNSVMKKYIVKNYKGNLVESLKNFSKKYKKMRIVEAVANDDELSIKVEASDDNEDSTFDLSSVKNESLKKLLEVAVNNGFKIEKSYDYDLIYGLFGYKITKDGLKTGMDIAKELWKFCKEAGVKIPDNTTVQSGDEGDFAFQIFPRYLIWIVYSSEDYELYRKSPIEFFKTHKTFHKKTPNYNK